MNLYPDNVSASERRIKPRIKCDCAAMIRGVDESGKRIEEGGRVINLSRSGMYVLLNREIQNGVQLWIKTALPTGILNSDASKLGVHGVVVRGEVHSGSIFGIGINFEKYRFV